MKNRTVIIIAHRMSTIEKCDRYLFLKKVKSLKKVVSMSLKPKEDFFLSFLRTNKIEHYFSIKN